MAHPEEPTLPEDTGQRKNKNMEELMKMIVRRTALAVCTLVLAVILPQLLPLPAHALMTCRSLRTAMKA